MKKILVIAVCVLMVSTLAAGCSSKGNSNGGGTSGTANAGKTTLTIAMASDMNGLDPFNTAASSEVLASYFIYDGLFNIKTDNTYEPLVAEKWNISDDGLTYTFTIRQGIKFQDGNTLTPEDVVYSFDRAAQSPYMSMLSGNIKSVAANGQDVVVTLKSADSSFMAVLAQVFMVFEKAYTTQADTDKTIATKPMGCGAYSVVSFGNNNLVLKANPDYYLGKPPITDVTIRIIPDASTALIALQNGEIDMFNYAPKAQIETLKSDPNIDVHIYPHYKTMLAELNTKVKGLDNQQVRQAINYAVNRQNMVDVCEEGYGAPATGLINSVIFGYSDKITGYTYDINKAKQMLSDAGYPDGAGIPTLTIDCMAVAQDQATILQADLKAIGIDAKVNVLEANAMMSRASNGENQITLFGMEFGRDAAFYENMVGTKAVFNWTQHSIAGVDDLFAQAKSTTDANTRIDLYTQAMNLVNQDGSFVALYFPQTIFTVAKGLQIDSYWNGSMPKGFDLSWK